MPHNGTGRFVATARRQRGFTLLEALIAMLVLVFGMLGAALLMVRAQQAEFESYQRKHALMLIDDFVSRVQANRKLADNVVCYAITTNTTAGTPYLGSGNTTSFDCTTTLAGTAEARKRATADLLALEAALLGAGEKSSGGADVGALLNARGCVSQTGTPDDGYTLTVSVAWQGRSETSAPPANASCGKNLYGSETLRRVVTVTFVVPNLGVDAP